MAFCDLNTQISNGIKDRATELLKTSSKQEINNLFGENLVSGDDVNPSQSLINSYKEILRGNSEYEVQDTDTSEIREQLGIEDDESPLDYVKRQFPANAEILEDLRKGNPNVNIQFEDDVDSQFDLGSNTVVIGLSELNQIAKTNNLDLPTVIDNFLQHELTHASTALALKNPQNRAYVQRVLDEVLEHHKTTPFEDTLRQGMNPTALPRGLNNVDEFVADAMGNPYFEQYLKGIKKNQSVWDRLINFLRKLLGYQPKNSVYDQVRDFVLSDKIQAHNRAEVENPANSWIPELVYHGNGKAYIHAAEEYFTSKGVTAEVEDAFKNLPSAIIKIKNSIRETSSKETQQSLQRLLDSYNEVKDNQSIITTYVNMLTSGGVIAAELEKQMLATDKLTDDNQKLQMLYSLKKASQSLKDLAAISRNIIDIVKSSGENAKIRPFLNQLSGIANVENAIDERTVKIGGNSTFQLLATYNNNSIAAQKIDEEIGKIETVKTTLKHPGDIKVADKRIKVLQEQKNKLPIPETFKKIQAGQYQDASAIQLWTEAAIMNTHPIAFTLANMLKDMDAEVSREMLDSENDFQRALDKFIKDTKGSLRDQTKLYEPITDLVEIIDGIKEELPDGTLVYNIKGQQRMLVSSYSAEWLNDLNKLNTAITYYRDKNYEALKNRDKEISEKYEELFLKKRRERNIFLRDNAIREYEDKIYDMWELPEREITVDGITTTFAKERGDLFHQIENLERLRDGAAIEDLQNAYQEQIRLLYIELQQIRYPWDERGKEKTGLDRELMLIANEYSELKREYGEYVLTPEGKEKFEKDVQDIEDKVKNGFLSRSQADAKLNEITVTEMDDAFYEALDQVTEAITNASDRMLQVPEIAEILGKIDRTKIKDGYKKIRQLTAAFRDPTQVVDGILFSKVRPDLVEEIKNIQQELEELKDRTTKLKGLSVHDRMRYEQLRTTPPEDLLAGEADELKKLASELTAKKVVYAANKDLIDEYYTLLSQLAALSESSDTRYYLEAKEEQVTKIKESLKPDIAEQLQKNGKIDNYEFDNGTWYKVVSIDEENLVRNRDIIKGTPEFTALELIIEDVALSRARAQLSQSEWWDKNHYTYYEFDPESREYYPSSRPIYIWNKSEPKNKDYIKSGQPSIKYKTYTIHDTYKTSDYSEISPRIPFPKQGKYMSPKFQSLDKPHREFLEFVRVKYRDAQQYYPENRKMGDILPSLVATEDERKVQMTNTVLGSTSGKMLTSNLLKIGLGKSEDLDQQTALGGSTTNYFVVNREIPIRFAGEIDYKEQSANIPAMVLTFETAARKYNKLIDKQGMFETLRTIVDNLPVEESLYRSGKFSLGNIFSAVKHSDKITSQKKTEKSNLSRTLDFILDSQVYGETKKNSTVNTLIGVIDMHKISGTLKTISSRSIFALNLFSAAKNTMSAKVQSYINSDQFRRFYSFYDYEKGSYKSKKYIAELTRDFTKFGNKSYIGQAMRYFQVMHGSVSNELGRKTQWTALKDAGSYLTIFKHISEYELQLTQFFAISEANKVKDPDGNDVPFIEAYGLDSNSNFTLKPGFSVTKEQENSFIKKVAFVNRTINGAYREDERNNSQRYVLGDLAFYLNGYFVPGLVNRFASTRYSAEGDFVTRGYYLDFATFIGNLVRMRGNLTQNWSLMTDREKSNTLKFLKELGFLVALTLTVGALGGDEGKSELKKRSTAELAMLALAMGVKVETETFLPLPGFGLNDMARKMNSPFAAVRQISTIVTALENASYFVVGNEKGFYKKTSVKDGFHDKGDAKVVANFLKLVGYSNMGFDPLDRITRQRTIENMH